MKRSKKYIEVQKLVETNKKYSLAEALALLPKISVTSFAGSVSMQINLNLNEKQKKEVFRGSYTLPHSFGKSLRVLVIADKSDHDKAKGADFVGAEELVKEIEEGKDDFDLVITTPMMMPKMAKLGKTLGTKGLMPNPKNGTITTDLEATITKFKKGMKNFKADNGIIIGVIGKLDMPVEDLTENSVEFMKAVNSEIKKLGPSAIKSIFLTPTMGPKLTIVL
jgi:large subunit ribosomal protein L1